MRQKEASCLQVGLCAQAQPGGEAAGEAGLALRGVAAQEHPDARRLLLQRAPLGWVGLVLRAEQQHMQLQNKRKLWAYAAAACPCMRAQQAPLHCMLPGSASLVCTGASVAEAEEGTCGDA